MKIKHLLTSISGIALIGLGFILCNGCGKQPRAAAPPSAEFQKTMKASAEPTSFNNVAAQLDAGGNLYLYLSTEQWLEGLSDKISKWREFVAALPDVSASDQADINKVFDIVTRLVRDSGVEDVSGVGMSSIAVEKGFYRSKAVVHHYKGKGAGFGWTLFGSAAHPLTSLDLLPSTTAMAMFSDLDLGQLWTVIQDEVKHSGFPQAQQFLEQMPKEFQRNTGLDWDKTLASFGGEYGIVLTMDQSKMIPIPLPTSEQLEIPEPGLLIVARANDDTLFNHFEKMLVQTRQQIIRVDKDGVKMRTIAVPLPLPMSVRPTIALANGYLFIASSDALVQEALAVKSGKTPGLKSTDEFKRLSQDIPLQGNQFSYMSQRFGQTVMKIQQQVMAMRSQSGQSPDEPNWAGLMQTFMKPENAAYSFCVGANTDEGWMTVGNGNQNAALMLAVVPAAGVGMLAAVAIPNFVKAKSTAQKNSCINNLRQIDGAKEQWALENKKNTGAMPKESDITPYMRGGRMPVCPQGGEYTIGAVGTNPQCSIPGHSLDY